MALVTGSAFGSITSSEELYLESAPQIYIASTDTPYMFNPDSDGLI